VNTTAVSRIGQPLLEVRKEIIEKSFLELLERLELGDRSQKTIRTSLVGINLEQQSQVQEERRRLESRITEIEKKRANLTMAYACEKAISSEDYEQLMKELKISLAGARIEREELEDEYMNLADLFDFALYLLADPKRMWLKSSLKQRLAIQKCLFPEGLKYSKETGFGTAVTSEYFMLLEDLQGPDMKVATHFYSALNRLGRWLAGIVESKKHILEACATGESA
jgi:hypothetical protein